MPRPSKLRWVLKWSGLALCALTLLGYPVSYGRWLGVVSPLYGEPWIAICRGQLRAGSYRSNSFPGFPGTIRARTYHVSEENTEFFVELLHGYTIIRVPLWAIFVALAIPTALLWRRDRQSRIPPGHCQECGYNLTGNVSGICPECERPVPKST